MDRELILEFVRVTEAAAIACGQWIGKGNKISADQAAVDAMRTTFDSLSISGKVVIGEGEMDEAPRLFIGEEVGGGGLIVDIAVDPLEGTNLVAKGLSGAIAVIAVAPRGTLLHAPDMYMDKIVVGPKAAGQISITVPVIDNLRAVAKALERNIEDLTVAILDRSRHERIINEVREAGARIKLITDGDISPAINTAIEGTGIHMMLGIGGAPEGVIAAAGMKCLGGDMQAKLWPETNKEIERAKQMGITDINKVYTIDDLVSSDEVMFAATAITQGNLLNGVLYFAGGVRTNSIVMRCATGTIRFIDAIHRWDKKPMFIKRT